MQKLLEWGKAHWRKVALFVAGGLTAVGYEHAASIIRVLLQLAGGQ